MKRCGLLLWLLLWMVAPSVRADVQVVASAGSAASVGGRITLSVKVNTNKSVEAGELSLPEGVEKLYGPARSSNSSISIVNGKTTSESSTTLTYTLSASKAGEFVLGPLTVSVGGQTYKSNTVKVTVVEGDLPGQSSGGSKKTGSGSGNKVATSGSGKDLFVTATANKREVWEQEPVLLSYKVYTRLNLTQLSGKMPDLNGCLSKEIKLPDEKNFSVEAWGGENYYSVEWSRYVLFPQKAGTVSVPSIKFEGIVVYQDAFEDIFDAFFSGRRAGRQVKREISAPGVEIRVKPLPQGKPEDFSGGVGTFSIKSSLKTKAARTGESVDVEVLISGLGNLDLITPPELAWPDGFEAYEPKAEVDSRVTSEGMRGSLRLSYVAIPQSKGTYTIPAVRLSYFDLGSGTYKTIESEPLTVEVAQGEKASLSGKKRAVSAQSDIRYLKQWEWKPGKGGREFFGSRLHWALYVGLIVLLVVIVLLVKLAGRRGRATGDGRKEKKCLRRARQALRAGKEDVFYEEVLAGVRSFLGSRLGIADADLNESSIDEGLSRSGVDEATREGVKELLSSCEMHRYGAVSSERGAEETLSEAERIVGVLDKVLKKKGRRAKQGVLLAVVLGLACEVASQPIQNSEFRIQDGNDMVRQSVKDAETGTKDGNETLALFDSLYNAGRYEEAAAQLEPLAGQQRHPYLYYNLGNAYYRANAIGKAILNYERAYLLKPTDGDIGYNLALARTKTADMVEADRSLGEWLRSLVGALSADGWAVLGVWAFGLMVLGLLGYLLLRGRGWRKAGFGLAVLGLVLTVLLNIMALSAHRNLTGGQKGIVMSTATVRSTPSVSGNILFTLHEGTKVGIADDGMRDYVKVDLPDGKVGWMERRLLEAI